MKVMIRLIALLLPLLAVQAFAAEPLVATLEANKVVQATDGKEQLSPAAQAKPGDVLQYKATYKNVSDKPLRGVMATLPVPATGVEYIAATANPQRVEASIDGVQFAPAPLKRLVKKPQGGYEQVLVPTSEYRFLRWPLGDLPAGASKSVTARMRVSTAPVLTTDQ